MQIARSVVRILRIGRLKNQIKKVWLSILAIIVLSIGLSFGIVSGQEGTDSHLSVNMTGINSSYLVLGMSGVGDSRFILEGVSLSVYPPTSLVLTYINTDTVEVEWVKGLYAYWSMVRAAVGRIPEDREDGYLVYYGTASTVTDTGHGINLDEDTVYYRVWSQNVWEVWENTGIYDSIGGIMAILFALLLIPIVFTVCFLWKREMWLGIIGVVAWFCVGIYYMTELSSAANLTQISDIWMAMGWICMMATIALGLVLFRWGRKANETWQEEEDEEGGEPYMRLYVKGEPSSKTRSMTTLEIRDRERRVAEAKASQSSGGVKSTKPSNFSKSGQL